MTGCPCACHGGPGAFPPPCDLPGGCGPHEDDRTCPVDGCRNWPDPILCRHHTDDVGNMLARLGTLWDALDAAPSMQGREPDTGGSGGLKSERTPARLDVIALRDPRTPADPDTRARSVLATLAGWAEQVRAHPDDGGRGLTPPTAEFRVRRDDRHAGPYCEDCDHGSCRALTFVAAYWVLPTVASERRLLADHLGWICTQDWAGVFYDEIRAVHGLLTSAQPGGGGIPRPRRTCPDCGGTVAVTGGAATCGGCERRWEGLEMARLGGVAA